MPDCSAIASLAQPDTFWGVLRDQLTQIPWTNWQGFWMDQVLPGRNTVVLFLPLLLILLLLSRRHLRVAIILTGTAFIGYVFGAVYLFLWLLTCVVLFRLSEWYAGTVERQGATRWPSLAAIGIICGHFALIHILDDVDLPSAWNAWLLAHGDWLLPLGARGGTWDPHWFVRPGHEFQLFGALLDQPHNIGAAYLTMRMVSYFSELKRRTIPRERRTLLNFAAYLCYIPTLIQGPIERYKEFNDEIDTCHTRRSIRDILAGLGRMLLGAAKIVLTLGCLGPTLWRLKIAGDSFYGHPEQTESYALLFFAVHLQVLLLYLIFSGYCDVAIGMSRLLGYRVIENFKRPWMACSLPDMWRRWHISLSFILRDYVFFPLTRRRWNNELNLLITFLVCGIWHDLSGKYAVWGLVMGLLVAVNHRWARWMRKLDRNPKRRLSRLRRSWLKLQPLPKICAWLLTINVFVMTGWIVFGGWGAVRVAWELIRRPAEWLLQDWGVTLPPILPPAQQ